MSCSRMQQLFPSLLNVAQTRARAILVVSAFEDNRIEDASARYR